MGNTLGAARPKKVKCRSFRWSLRTAIGGCVLLATSTTIAPDAMLVALLTMCMLVALPVALATDVLLAANSRKYDDLQFSLRDMVVAFMCLCVYLSLLRDPWTFRLRFAVSRPALERLAARADEGQQLAKPEAAGLFLIRQMKRVEYNGNTYTVLWTEPGGSCPSGFVRPAPEHGWLNDWSSAPSYGPWQFFIQD